MRKLLSLLALGLTVASLSGAPAFGAAQGTDRPFNGSGSGTGVLGSSADGTENASHLGLATFHADVVPTGPTTATTTTTLVAANGDTVTMSGPSTLVPVTATTFTFTIVYTITGGTGRFADASGAETTTGTGTVDSPTTFHVSFTFTGTITY